MAPFNRQAQVGGVVRAELDLMVVEAGEVSDEQFNAWRVDYERDYLSGEDNWLWFQGYPVAGYDLNWDEYPWWNPVENKWEY